MDYLGLRISLPLEREYEAWIVQQVVDYFEALSVKAEVFAVSPADEQSWPADEVIRNGGKLVGLQFKRPKLGSSRSTNDFSRLHWVFSSPKGQLNLVATRSEIFYCLPTFVNREVRNQALSHCLFWRPDDQTQSRAWYCNPDPKVRTKYSCVADAMRWGRFVEGFFECSVGLRLEGGITFRRYIARIAELLRQVHPEREITLHYLYLPG